MTDKAYEDFRFVGVDGGALRLLDQHLPMEVAIGDLILSQKNSAT